MRLGLSLGYQTAWTTPADHLALAWPEAKLIMVPDAGHSAMEPGIRAQLVAALERFKMAA